jgi:aminoglycoside phosphotransferase (APT) family kinase protein
VIAPDNGSVLVARETWYRSPPAVDLDLGQLTQLIQPALPGASVIERTPTEGGFANANYRLLLADREAPLLIRFFVRDPQAAGKEFVLNRLLVNHRLPVVPYLHVAPDNPFTGHPYAVREWAAGERLEIVARDLTDAATAELGRSVGSILARIHAITFPQTGFLDSSLRVAEPASMGSDGLVAFLQLCLVKGRGAQRIESDLIRSVIAFAEREGRILDGWTGDPCLVHSDFGGSNILIRRVGPRWEVASILDWEFAFSGTPFFDFGNLLRPALGERPGFAASVVAGYREAGGNLPDNWRRMSLLVDLFNWADFLDRPQASPAIIADAKAMIERTIATW